MSGRGLQNTECSFMYIDGIKYNLLKHCKLRETNKVWYTFWTFDKNFIENKYFDPLDIAFGRRKNPNWDPLDVASIGHK